MIQRTINIGRSNATTTTQQFIPIMGGEIGTSGAIEYRTQSACPTAGKFRNLRVLALDNPATSKSSYNFFLRVNGVDTALTVSIAADASPLSASDTNPAHEVSVSPADLLSFRVIGINGGDGAPVQIRFTFMMDFESSTANESIILSSNENGSSVAGSFFAPGVVIDGSTSEGNKQFVVPAAGKIKKMYIHLTSAPGVGATRRFILRVNKTTDTALTCDIADTATDNNDVTHDVDVNAGDLIAVRCDFPSGAPAASRVSMGFVFAPTVAGTFIFGTNSSSSVPNSVPFYLALAGSLFYNTSDADVNQMGWSDIQINAVYAAASGTPGSGKSYDFVLRKDGGASVPDMDFSIANLETAKSNITESVTLADWSKYNFMVTPTNTPSIRTISVSCAAKLLDTATDGRTMKLRIA